METQKLSARLELRSFNEDDGTFQGIASVFGELDSYDDTVAEGAFKKTLKERGSQGIKMLWQHRATEPIGIWTDVQEDKKGLLVEGKLALGTQRGKEAHELLKMGALDGLSIGFMTKKYEMDEDTGIRMLQEIDLWEISLVTFPALSSARITDVKMAVPFQDLPLSPRERPWKKSEANKRLREWANVSDAPNAKYKKAFLWYDKENADKFEAYKLQIGDILGGSLTAIPRGIFAAAAVMQGARGGVNVPEGDRKGIKRHIEKYYTKMQKKFNDDGLVPPWKKECGFSSALSSMGDLIETERDFETFLRDAGWSRRESEMIVAKGFRLVLRQREPATLLVESIRKMTQSLQS